MMEAVVTGKSGEEEQNPASTHLQGVEQNES